MEIPTSLVQYKQVLQLATLPTNQEFKQTAQIAGAGIVLVGMLGFIIFTLMTVFPG